MTKTRKKYYSQEEKDKRKAEGEALRLNSRKRLECERYSTFTEAFSAVSRMVSRNPEPAGYKWKIVRRGNARETRCFDAIMYGPKPE